jgi:hypothetical protein
VGREIFRGYLCHGSKSRHVSPARFAAGWPGTQCLFVQAPECSEFAPLALAFRAVLQPPISRIDSSMRDRPSLDHQPITSPATPNPTNCTKMAPDPLKIVKLRPCLTRIHVTTSIVSIRLPQTVFARLCGKFAHHQLHQLPLRNSPTGLPLGPFLLMARPSKALAMDCGRPSPSGRSRLDR